MEHRKGKLSNLSHFSLAYLLETKYVKPCLFSFRWFELNLRLCWEGVEADEDEGTRGRAERDSKQR